MIDIERYRLANGLTVITHVDRSTPMAAVNLLYKVGARNENPDKTGFAHLFEHLMFGGSRNIPSYDTPLQNVGGENNAFTTNDITDYYLTLPADNLETAFWLESDRMLELAFSQESLDVQKKVVTEEFKQRYFNQPYGDIPLLARPLAYKVHPYRWPTIGSDISHIEKAELDDVRRFFFAHYAPDNAILVVAGNVDADRVNPLADKWFGPISRQSAPRLPIPAEPEQTERRELHVERSVPADYIHMQFHMGGRLDREYYVCDTLTDILADGASSRLTQRLIKDRRLFSDVNAFISGDDDPGLLSLTGTLMPGVGFAQAEQALLDEALLIADKGITAREFEKIKIRNEASMVYAEMSYANKANNLAYFEHLSEAEAINREVEIYNSIGIDEVRQASERIFRPANASVLYYHSLKN